MTIDIHKMITGNPISKNSLKPWSSNSKPNSLRGKLFNRENDRCSMFQDIKYTVAENIGKDSKDIKNRKLDADKEWLDCFKPRTPYDMLAYSVIKSKKTLG